MESITSPLLHPTWKIDAKAPAQVRHLLQRCKESLGSGAFSTVMAVDHYTVLKLSTCEASKVILPTLVGNPTPGLPLVYKAFGQVGEVVFPDTQDPPLPIYAYLIERLWSAEDLGEMTALRKDHCPRGDAMRAKTPSDAAGAYRWLSRKITDSPAWYDEHWRSTIPAEKPHPLVTSVHEILAHTRFKPLIGVLRRLSHRVKSGEWRFDWVNRFDYNVMLSGWGEPILADPVYNSNQPIWKRTLYGEDDESGNSWGS